MAVLLLGLGLPALASTASSLVALDADIGFGNTFVLGRWAPVTVTVENRGPAARATLEVRATDGDVLTQDERTVVHARALDLARDARKRLRFIVRLESFSKPLTVRLVQGESVLGEHSFELRSRFTDAALVLALSRDADLDFLNVAAGSGRGAGGTRVVYPHPQSLPSRWHGFDGVRAVVVHGISLEPLSAEQFEALEKWIAAGGVFIYSGSPDLGLTRTPRLAQLLPAAPEGSARVENADALPELPALHAPRPFRVHRVVPERGRGRVTLAAGGRPLVIEERFGRGKVLYLAFDLARYPFSTWPGLEPLLTEAIADGRPARGDAARLSLAPKAALRDAPIVPLLSDPSVGFPRNLIIIVFVCVYCGALAAILHGPRLKRPAATAEQAGRTRSVETGPPWRAAALALCPLTLAPLAYVLFGPLLFPLGATSLAAATVRPLQGSGYAAAQFDLAFYANRPGPLELRFTGARPALVATAEALTDELPRWAYRDTAAGASVQVAAVAPYRLHHLSGNDVVAFELSASARRERGRWRVTVRNGSGRRLAPAWIALNGALYSLGALAPQAEFDATLALDEAVDEFPETNWDAALASLEGMRLRRAKLRLLEDATAAAGVQQGLLLGFTSPPLLRPTKEAAAWQHLDLSLVVSPVRVSFGDQGLGPGGDEALMDGGAE